MDLGPLIRAVRRARRLSQRELAAIAGVPPSTVDRIEAGRSNPRIETVLALLRATGYTFVVADRHGRLLELDPERERLRDESGRHFPAHLYSHEIKDIIDSWWGWFRIAWWPADPGVPSHTYHKRPRYRCWAEWEVWMDAT